MERLGAPVPGLERLGLTHTFPSAATLAGADLGGLGLTPARAHGIGLFAQAVAEDAVRLDLSIGLDRLVASITALDGLGPWTAHYLALRLGEPDACPITDLALRRALPRRAPLRPPSSTTSPSAGGRGVRWPRHTSGSPTALSRLRSRGRVQPGALHEPAGVEHASTPADRGISRKPASRRRRRTGSFRRRMPGL